MSRRRRLERSKYREGLTKLVVTQPPPSLQCQWSQTSEGVLSCHSFALNSTILGPFVVRPHHQSIEIAHDRSNDRANVEVRCERNTVNFACVEKFRIPCCVRKRTSSTSVSVVIQIRSESSL